MRNPREDLGYWRSPAYVKDARHQEWTERQAQNLKVREEEQNERGVIEDKQKKETTEVKKKEEQETATRKDFNESVQPQSPSDGRTSYGLKPSMLSKAATAGTLRPPVRPSITTISEPLSSGLPLPTAASSTTTGLAPFHTPTGLLSSTPQTPQWAPVTAVHPNISSPDPRDNVLSASPLPAT
ncbi:hypothetical protein Slin14017_G128920 [Septoria linicola]|nr:hypothetical protein Slin14017_G128920 [Septoria linicola]